MLERIDDMHVGSKCKKKPFGSIYNYYMYIPYNCSANFFSVVGNLRRSTKYAVVRILVRSIFASSPTNYDVSSKRAPNNAIILSLTAFLAITGILILILTLISIPDVYGQNKMKND